jgi:hypothetical protein
MTWTIPLSLTPLTHKGKGRVILIRQYAIIHDIDEVGFSTVSIGPLSFRNSEEKALRGECNGVSPSVFTHKD